MRLRRRHCIDLTFCLCLWALPVALVRAEPVPAEQAKTVLDAPPLVLEAATDSATELDAWVLRETTEALMQRQVDQDRLAVVRQGFAWRAPTWIQNASTVNLGDFPTLQDPTASAERELRTLEWLIEERNRRGAAAHQPADDDADASNHWLRQLLPTQWVRYLKSHREQVLAGGATVLLLIWAGAAAQQRRGNGAASSKAPPSTIAPTDEPPRARHRRRRRSDMPHGDHRHTSQHHR